MAHKRLHEHMQHHMPGDTRFARFNRKFFSKITAFVGSPACAYLFAVLAFLSLPAVLANFAVFQGVFPAVLIKASLIALIAWIAQTFLQLVLLSVIMVGQDVQTQATTEAIAKTEANTEATLDMLNTQTEGGLKVLSDKLDLLLKGSGA